jgi:hypothetical protein
VSNRSKSANSSHERSVNDPLEVGNRKPAISVQPRIDPARKEWELLPIGILASQSASELALGGIVSLIGEINRKRKTILDRMRRALESGDRDEVVKVAWQLCGLSDAEASQIPPRIN